MALLPETSTTVKQCAVRKGVAECGNCTNTGPMTFPGDPWSLSGQISPNFGQNASYQSGQNGTKMPRKPNRRSGQKCQKILQHVFQSGQISAWSTVMDLTPGPVITEVFQMKQYLLIPSIQFLCLLDTKFHLTSIRKIGNFYIVLVDYCRHRSCIV